MALTTLNYLLHDMDSSGTWTCMSVRNRLYTALHSRFERLLPTPRSTLALCSQCVVPKTSLPEWIDRPSCCVHHHLTLLYRLRSVQAALDPAPQERSSSSLLDVVVPALVPTLRLALTDIVRRREFMWRDARRDTLMQSNTSDVLEEGEEEELHLHTSSVNMGGSVASTVAKETVTQERLFSSHGVAALTSGHP